MEIIEVFTDCIAHPIRFIARSGGQFSDSIEIAVCDDNPAFNLPRYFLKIPCGKANVDAIPHLQRLQCRANRQTSSVSLYKNRQAICIHYESCTFRRLTMQELFIPLVIDELHPDKPKIPAHWYN
jgi:hypothetical protein